MSQRHYLVMCIIGVVLSIGVGGSQFLFALDQVNQLHQSMCTSYPESLDGQIITHISIEQLPIFEPPLQGALAPVYSAANRLHRKTQLSVIEHDLLFQIGDIFDEQVVAATERRLRKREYFNGASIISTLICKNNGVGVHVQVQVREAWTLEPQFRFSQTGDELTYNIGIQEKNLFGLGKKIAASRYSDVYREGYQLYYFDPNTGLYESQMHVGYANNDDGGYIRGSWSRPFVALDTSWSAGMQVLDSEQDDRVYDIGNEVDRYKVFHTGGRVYYGQSLQRHVYDQSQVTRVIVGLDYVDKSYAAVEQTISSGLIPADFSFYMSWIELQWLRHQYRKMTNVTAINSIEDINFDWVFSGQVGVVFSPNVFLDERVLLSASVQRFFLFTTTQILQIDGRLSTLMKSHDISDAVDSAMNMTLQYYWNPAIFQSQVQLYLKYHEARVIEPLNNQYLDIGANLGARGYPARYQSGSRRQIVTVEQRYFGAQEWFSLVYIGGAIFYDASHTWGDSIMTPEQQGWLHSLGIGLRVSSHRLGTSEGGGYSTLHIDLAAPVGAERPVDSTQLLVTVKKNF